MLVLLLLLVPLVLSGCDSTPDGSLDASVRPDAAPGIDSGVSDDDAGAGELVDLLFRVQVPASTPAGATIYVAGNFQGWDPASPAHAFAAVGPRTYELGLSFPRGTRLELKLTRGSWETVEKGPNGEEIRNRTLTASTSMTVELTVASWSDASPRPSTITGDVRTTTVTGFLEGRRVWIYLPPGYDASNTRYPVLYMLDGQNVFDASTSFSGEWQVDEALERSIPDDEVAPLIVVAVGNSARRIEEYTPWADPRHGGGGAAAHLAAITDVLMPWVNATFRTLTGPENTGISGSSLGGLFTLYATYARPDLFGKNAALSPSIWFADEAIIDFVRASSKPDARVWMDMGTNESATAIGELRELRDLMVTQGFVLDVDLKVVEEAGGAHNEAAWARRFPDVLRFLFPAR